jgi:hypothetical protein
VLSLGRVGVVVALRNLSSSASIHILISSGVCPVYDGGKACGISISASTEVAGFAHPISNTAHKNFAEFFIVYLQFA